MRIVMHMSDSMKVAIVGASGYAGAELIRLIHNLSRNIKLILVIYTGWHMNLYLVVYKLRMPIYMIY